MPSRRPAAVVTMNRRLQWIHAFSSTEAVVRHCVLWLPLMKVDDAAGINRVSNVLQPRGAMKPIRLPATRGGG